MKRDERPKKGDRRKKLLSGKQKKELLPGGVFDLGV